MQRPPACSELLQRPLPSGTTALHVSCKRHSRKTGNSSWRSTTCAPGATPSPISDDRFGNAKMVQIHPKSQSSSPLRGRILLVDDDPGLFRLLSIRLRAEHYDVEAVESAAEALAALSRFRPDLVVTDLRMDNMDGIQLLKEIQRQRPGLCVLLLTAHGTIPDAVEATQSGPCGLLTEPGA